MTTEVLILGGGYTAVWAARRLVRDLRRSGRHRDVRVTLVSATPTHAFHGWTAEVITGHVRLERTLTPLAELLPDVRVLTGVAAEVDLDRREVAVADADGMTRLRYDQLVLGVGSRDACERVPGLADHGFTTKGDGQLARLTTHLDEVVARAASTADEAERARLLTVVVAGGGFAGVETAVAVRQRLVATVARHASLAGWRPEVLLVHAGPELLPSLRPRFARVAEHAGRQVGLAGVQVRCGTRLTSVRASGVTLTGPDDPETVGAATVISTLGQAPVAMPGTESLTRDAGGRLVVDRQLRVQREGRVVEGVWAGGDLAAVPHPSGSGVCPSSALWAIYHGELAGTNVARSIRGRGPRPFRFPGLGQAASFGVGEASAELAGVPLLGWSGWLARWVLFHYYMPSRTVAGRTILEWCRPGRRQSSPVEVGCFDRIPVSR